jgi:hypothetical protein
MQTVLNVGQRPAFTFCLKNKNKFPDKFQNQYMRLFFDQPIGCWKDRRVGLKAYVNCRNLTRIVESVTPYSRSCLTYYSQLLRKNNYFPLESDQHFIIDNEINVFALIHQNITPPHFSRDKIDIQKLSLNHIDYSSITTNLLPFPHSTDCFDYKQEENLKMSYKSREDCIVKHLERREFVKCGCNKRWTYREFSTENHSNICEKSVKCNFDAISQINSMEIICKKNCLNEYFINIITNADLREELEIFNSNFFLPFKSSKQEIIFNYKPKMNFVEYLCSVGGLVSMWFGYSFYDFVLIFINKSKKMIRHV